MAHRNLLREAFGFICMAVVVKKTNKASTTIARNTVIDDITDAASESKIPPLMTLPEFMTATEPTGFLPFLLTLLVPLLCYFGDQVIEWTAEFLLFNGLLPLLRITKRHFLAMIAYANRCLLEMRARMGAFDDTVLDNTRQSTNQIDEESRSGPPQATPATSNGNEDGAQESSIDVPNPTATSPETEQTLAVLETLLKESAEKDVQIQTLSEEVQTQAQTIANLDQRNTSFETELRTALDPTSLQPPSKDVVAIASDLAEDFKRASEKVERGKELQRVVDGLSDDLKRVSTEAGCEKRRFEDAANDLAKDLRRVSEEAEHQKEMLEKAANDLAEDLRSVSAEGEREKRRLEDAANDLAKDLRRVSEEAEHQKELEKERDRSESNRVAEKENEITRLSEESTKLSSQIEKLVNTERQAKATEKRLRERVQVAEHTAANSYDERTYMTLRNQFDVVVGELNSAKNERQHAIDAQGRLTTELEAETAKVAQLQAVTHEEAAASQQSESLVNTKTAEIQLANERIVSLEREVQDKCRELENKRKELEDKCNELKDKCKELEDKDKELEGVEARARYAEEQNANDETKIGELQRDLQATQDQAKHANESNTLLKQELQKAKNELEDKDSAGKPEVVESVSTDDLAAEIKNLHSQLEEANKKANDAFQDGFCLGVTEGITSDGNLQPHRQQEDASVQTVEPGEDPLYEQVRQETLVSCEAKAAVLINEAVQQERGQGQERLEAAVAQREQAVKNSADDAWNRREAEWRDLVNTQVGSADPDQQTSLQAELFITQQRANDAEAKVNVEAQRAQAAELEIQKYKKGKAAQDERIKGYTTEIAGLKRLVPTALQQAELDCSANDQLRAQAILDETPHGTYDSLSGEVLQQLQGVNRQITELRLILKTQDKAQTRDQLLEILQDAYIDKDKVNDLWIPDRQVLFQQCSGAAMRLAELRKVIRENPASDKEAILAVLYKDRGDEDAEWNRPDSGFFANEDENVNRMENPGLREKLIPTTRKPKPAVTAQAQDPQLPNGPRGDQNLKRKDNPEDSRGDGSVFSQYPQQGPSSQEAVGERGETMQGVQLDPAQEDRLRKILARQQQQRQQQQQQVQGQGQGQDNNNPQPFSMPASSSFNFNFAAPPASSSPEYVPHLAGPFANPTASSSSERPPLFNFANPLIPQSEHTTASSFSSSTDTATLKRRTSTFSFTAPVDKAPGM